MVSCRGGGQQNACYAWACGIQEHDMLYDKSRKVNFWPKLISQYEIFGKLMKGRLVSWKNEKNKNFARFFMHIRYSIQNSICDAIYWPAFFLFYSEI